MYGIVGWYLAPGHDRDLAYAVPDLFEGRRAGYRFPRAVSIFSNLAWRLLLLNLWSRRYLAA